MSKLTDWTLKAAWETLGVHEAGTSNSGKWVNQYLAFVRLKPGNPWCAAYVAYRVHHAASDLGLRTDWPKTGLVQAIYNWAKKRNLVHRVPREGDVFLVWSASARRYNHTGFVLHVNGGSFATIEGNSNSTGAREGTMVCSNVRILTPGKYRFVTPQGQA